MGAGTTTLAVFAAGHMVHADGVAVGSHHVTMDLARGLSTSLGDAERIKVLNGAAFATKSDEREIIAVPPISEDERDLPHQVSRAQIVRIIRPRVDEILELIRDRLKASGTADEAGRRVVLTGGGAQMPGLSDLAATSSAARCAWRAGRGHRSSRRRQGPALRRRRRAHRLPADRGHRAFRAEARLFRATARMGTSPGSGGGSSRVSSSPAPVRLRCQRSVVIATSGGRASDSNEPRNDDQPEDARHPAS